MFQLIFTRVYIWVSSEVWCVVRSQQMFKTTSLFDRTPIQEDASGYIFLFFYKMITLFLSFAHIYSQYFFFPQSLVKWSNILSSAFYCFYFWFISLVLLSTSYFQQKLEQFNFCAIGSISGVFTSTIVINYKSFRMLSAFDPNVFRFNDDIS